MLSDDNASRAAWLGDNGALAAMTAGSIVVECGTVSPDWIAELNQIATARGLRVLEAPVTGSRPQAEAGQLTFLVGSDAETLEAARPVLVPMSKSIMHVGPVGTGGQLKLINNFLCGVQVASFAEAVAWVEGTDLNRGQALDFLKTGAAGSGILTAMTDRMTARTYEVNFLLRLLKKDLRYAQHAAADKGVILTTAAVAEALFDKAETQGLGEKDMSAVIEVLRAEHGA
jgi:3-hydroxyisobutyrate dehydrogenase